MLKVEHKVLGVCGTNCYFIFDGGSKTPSGDFIDDGKAKPAIIVDPAAEMSQIEAMVTKLNLRPVAVLLTHGHFDHILALDDVRNKYGIQAYALDAEEEIITDANKNLSIPFTGDGFTTNADIYVSDGTAINVGGHEVRVIAVPGHTVGGACYYFPKDKILISGDTLFSQSVGRSDFPTGSASTLIRSINEKLFVLDDDTKVYPGHGDSTTIGYEKENNPFLA